MTPAVIYARVSSREQEQEGYSIPAQLKALHAYASKNGIEVIAEFIDVETAKTTGRKAFGEMLTFLKRSRNSRRVLVEKTDRLYRNLSDCVELENLETEIHFVKSGNIVSKNAKAQTKFVHDIELASARFYSGNFREEVIKGMREKEEQGIFPGHAPFGYVNNKATREIDVDPKESEIVKRIFALYATGDYPLTRLRNQIRNEYGKTMTRSNLHKILNNRVYVGFFVWDAQSYPGKHDTYISPQLFENAQAVMHGHNKGKYGKHDIAFRGMLTCAHDESTVTAELKKGKYVYYRCSGYRGKCELPRFREAQISEKLGQVLENIHVPDDVMNRILKSLSADLLRNKNVSAQQRARMEQQLQEVRSRMDQAYTDKLDGKIPEDFWQRKMKDWQAEEHRIEAQITGFKESGTDRVLNAQRILELANKAYFLYVTRKPREQAELLKKVLLNCSIDGVSVYPTYRKPFDMICERAKRKEWSGRENLNLAPPWSRTGNII